MNAHRREARDVDAVVDEHARAPPAPETDFHFARETRDRLDLSQQVPVGGVLLAHLHAADPDPEEALGDFRVRGRGALAPGGAVGDGVDPGEADGHAGGDSGV